MEKPQIDENNIHGGVNLPPISKSTHDNQPKEVIWDRGEYAEGAWPGVSVGKLQYHPFGGDKAQTKSNLVINFFLAG